MRRGFPNTQRASEIAVVKRLDHQHVGPDRHIADMPPIGPFRAKRISQLARRPIAQHRSRIDPPQAAIFGNLPAHRLQPLLEPANRPDIPAARNGALHPTTSDAASFLDSFHWELSSLFASNRRMGDKTSE